MVRTWPERRDYWLQWSGAYQRLDQNHQALAVLELAERRALAAHSGSTPIWTCPTRRQSVYSSYTRYAGKLSQLLPESLRERLLAS
jgi:hypothetical protein